MRPQELPLEVHELTPAGRHKWNERFLDRLKKRDPDLTQETVARDLWRRIHGEEDESVTPKMNSEVSKLARGYFQTLRSWFRHPSPKLAHLAGILRVDVDDLWADLEHAHANRGIDPSPVPTAPEFDIWQTAFPELEKGVIRIDPPMVALSGFTSGVLSARLFGEGYFEEQTRTKKITRWVWISGEPGSGRRTAAELFMDGWRAKRDKVAASGEKAPALVEPRVLTLEPEDGWAHEREEAATAAIVISDVSTAKEHGKEEDDILAPLPWGPFQASRLLWQLAAQDALPASAQQVASDTHAWLDLDLLEDATRPAEMIARISAHVRGEPITNPDTLLAGQLSTAWDQAVQRSTPETLVHFGPWLMEDFWAGRILDSDNEHWWLVTREKAIAGLEAAACTGPHPEPASRDLSQLLDEMAARGAHTKRRKELARRVKLLFLGRGGLLLHELIQVGLLLEDDSGSYRPHDEASARAWAARGLATRWSAPGTCDALLRQWPTLLGPCWDETIEALAKAGLPSASFLDFLDEAPPALSLDASRSAVIFAARCEQPMAIEALLPHWLAALWTELLDVYSHESTAMRRTRESQRFIDLAEIFPRVSIRYRGELPRLGGPDHVGSLEALISKDASEAHRLASTWRTPPDGEAAANESPLLDGFFELATSRGALQRQLVRLAPAQCPPLDEASLQYWSVPWSTVERERQWTLAFAWLSLHWAAEAGDDVAAAILTGYGDMLDPGIREYASALQTKLPPDLRLHWLVEAPPGDDDALRRVLGTLEELSDEWRPASGKLPPFTDRAVAAMKGLDRGRVLRMIEDLLSLDVVLDTERLHIHGSKYVRWPAPWLTQVALVAAEQFAAVEVLEAVSTQPEPWLAGLHIGVEHGQIAVRHGGGLVTSLRLDSEKLGSCASALEKATRTLRKMDQHFEDVACALHRLGRPEALRRQLRKAKGWELPRPVRDELRQAVLLVAALEVPVEVILASDIPADACRRVLEQRRAQPPEPLHTISMPTHNSLDALRALAGVLPKGPHQLATKTLCALGEQAPAPLPPEILSWLEALAQIPAWELSKAANIPSADHDGIRERALIRLVDFDDPYPLELWLELHNDRWQLGERDAFLHSKLQEKIRATPALQGALWTMATSVEQRQALLDWAIASALESNAPPPVWLVEALVVRPVEERARRCGLFSGHAGATALFERCHDASLSKREKAYWALKLHEVSPLNSYVLESALSWLDEGAPLANDDFWKRRSTQGWRVGALQLLEILQNWPRLQEAQERARLADLLTRLWELAVEQTLAWTAPSNDEDLEVTAARPFDLQPTGHHLDLLHEIGKALLAVNASDAITSTLSDLPTPTTHVPSKDAGNDGQLARSLRDWWYGTAPEEDLVALAEREGWCDPVLTDTLAWRGCRAVLPELEARIERAFGDDGPEGHAGEDLCYTLSLLASADIPLAVELANRVAETSPDEHAAMVRDVAHLDKHTPSSLLKSWLREQTFRLMEAGDAVHRRSRVRNGAGTGAR